MGAAPLPELFPSGAEDADEGVEADEGLEEEAAAGPDIENLAGL
jgi:hypothetical protein